MICKACSVPYCEEKDECFVKALDVLKKHYAYYKNALDQRDLELRQVKERNEKLNKALLLLQTNQHPAKRFKSQNNDDSWLANISSQGDRSGSELSLIDNEHANACNLNVALNSEQLFDTSALSQTKNDSNITSSTEIIHSPRLKESPKRNKQLETIRCLKDRRNRNLRKSKSEWHTKERSSPAEKSWAMQFIQHAKERNTVEETNNEVGKKPLDKKLYLSLKKTNPSKVKQSLIHFNKPKDSSFRESDKAEDVIDASPMVAATNSKLGRSWSHRSGQNYNSSCNNTTKETTREDDGHKTVDDIVFDFSPSKKTFLSQNSSSPGSLEPKKLKFNNENSTDCISLAIDNLGVSRNESDTSSVVILTPGTQDIIFVDDTCDIEPDIDTMELLGDVMKQSDTDSLEKLKKYESKCLLKQPQNKDIGLFKKPSSTASTDASSVIAVAKIKQEKATEENLLESKEVQETEEQKPCGSKSISNIKNVKHRNPLLSSDEHDTEDDEDFMPKPFLIKQESENSKKLSIKQRFNIDCEDCEKLINFLDSKLADAQIRVHLDKCKRHNNPSIMRQNTPNDFWNPFILSFQADDPRNEILIDSRFKDNKN